MSNVEETGILQDLWWVFSYVSNIMLTMEIVSENEAGFNLTARRTRRRLGIWYRTLGGCLVLRTPGLQAAVFSTARRLRRGEGNNFESAAYLFPVQSNIPDAPAHACCKGCEKNMRSNMSTWEEIKTLMSIGTYRCSVCHKMETKTNSRGAATRRWWSK